MSTVPLFAADPEIWAAHASSQAQFADERLNTRFQRILVTLAVKPMDSIPQATGSAGEAKAMYRFLSNERISEAELHDALVDATLDSIRGLAVVLAVQDSSSLNYASLTSTTGLGTLNDSSALGLHLHTNLAVRPDGVVLGLFSQSFWSRPVGKRTAPRRRQRPIKDKESFKWLEGIEAVEAALERLPDNERPRLIHIMDREGDVHEVLETVAGSPHGAVIRCAQNRKVAGPYGYAHPAVAATAPLATITISIPAGHGNKARRARVEVRSISATITPDKAKHPKRHPVAWTLIEVREIEAPDDVAEPIHWLLWTTEPAATLKEIEVVLGYYKLRWRVEDFHLTLKSGCRVEALALEKAVRLRKAILLYSAVAIRIVALRDLARIEPEAPCTNILGRPAWHALYARFERRRPTPNTPAPTVRQAIMWIGRLGGHLGRKQDRLPGVRTLWRGWRDLTLLTTGWLAAETTR
jgi:hypothetical protein